jgi:hypothetical protein
VTDEPPLEGVAATEDQVVPSPVPSNCTVAEKVEVPMAAATVFVVAPIGRIRQEVGVLAEQPELETDEVSCPVTGPDCPHAAEPSARKIPNKTNL